MKRGLYILLFTLAALGLHGQDKTAYTPSSTYNRGGEKVVILRMSDNASPTDIDLKNEARKYLEFAPNTVVFFRKDAYTRQHTRPLVLSGGPKQGHKRLSLCRV